MEYYESTPSRLNIKLRNIPLGRNTENDYLNIYHGLNQTLPVMQYEFSNLKHRAREYNRSLNPSMACSFIYNEPCNNLNYQFQNNQGYNNNINIINNNNNNIIGEPIGFRNISRNINYNNYSQGENLEKLIQERDTLINQFQDLMENCCQKLKKYKDENEILKKNLVKEENALNEDDNVNNNFDEMDYNNLKNNNFKRNKDNSNEVKQVKNLEKDINELINETKISQEKYNNQLDELVNKLSILGNNLK